MIGYSKLLVDLNVFVNGCMSPADDLSRVYLDFS